MWLHSISIDQTTKVAELLGAYFSSVYQVDSGSLSTPPSRLSNINVNRNSFTANVLKLLNKLDPRSAGGHDEIFPIFLINTAT